jgi:DNA-binding beta-propeller fold protein YncE
MVFPQYRFGVTNICTGLQWATCAAVGLLLAQAPQAQTPPASAMPTSAALNDAFRPRNRQLLYVALPGTLEATGFRNGLGLVVLDVNDNYRFVKRIPTWDTPASMSPEQVAGVTASPVTNMIYVALRGRLGAFDLRTEKKVWEATYDGKCCERPQVTPDGKYLVVGSDLQDYWYVVDPKSGKLLHKIMAPLSPSAHNLVLSPDGTTAFMSPNNPIMTIADIATGKVTKTIQFGDHIRPFVLNHNATLIYANTNNLDGFEIADVTSGKILKHIEASGDWKAKWNMVPRAVYGHGCPSHGIALVNNEKEVWVTDGVNQLIHIFDNTQETPKEIATIKPSANVYWFTIGLDGKFAYVSSGDIIDTKTRKIVGQMKDEFGNPMISEKLLDMTFADGKLQRVSNQFGNGFGDIDASGHTHLSTSR